jgi:hypothetical protein
MSRSIPPGITKPRAANALANVQQQTHRRISKLNNSSFATRREAHLGTLGDVSAAALPPNAPKPKPPGGGS